MSTNGRSALAAVSHVKAYATMLPTKGKGRDRFYESVSERGRERGQIQKLKIYEKINKVSL